MSVRLAFACVTCLALAGGRLSAADAPQPPDAEQLVKRLASPRFAEREAAFKALEALGPAALPALRGALADNDPEVRRRVGDLVARFERDADSAAAFLPTKVRLKADGVPLGDVVRDLVKQSQIRVLL